MHLLCLVSLLYAAPAEFRFQTTSKFIDLAINEADPEVKMKVYVAGSLEITLNIRCAIEAYT